ncbi:MAG TPA: acetolactate synthase small subunit [Candidatus Acidoferrum sp.]|nr:acetolactate synthase small subunit [Candidatus Acidoferrum sp.]
MTSPTGGVAATSPQVGRSEKVRVLSLLVEDGPNTLTKVAGAIRRRGFHVRGISVGPAREAGQSRITLEIDHGHAEADQVRKQLERVVEVLEVEDLTENAVHTRELVVAKVAGSELNGLLERGAKVLMQGADGTTVEFSGESKEVGEFVDELARHGVVDVVRSGPVVMRRTA